MSFTITKINYPKTLMLGEEYDFSKISVETDSNLTIDKIDATWLETQPPFNEMGYHSLQITATASNGETATEIVNVFVFDKPHDGYSKFIIFVYKGITRLVSYDCSDNSEHTAFYLDRIYLRHMSTSNGYLGQQGYNFNATTKQWDYNKDFTGYDDYVIRSGSFYADEILYCNSDIYDLDKTTLIYPADPCKKDLPMWDTDIVGRITVDYTNPLEYDDTIEAYYIVKAAYNGATQYPYALCFRNLSTPTLDLTLTPKDKKRPRFEHGDENVEHMLIRYQNGWRSTVAWRKQTYATQFGTISNDTNLGCLNFMNSLQEVHNINFGISDIDGKHKRSFLGEAESAPEVKLGKYRMKNDTTGEYETLHLETSIGQVVHLAETFDEVEASIAERYTKSEEDALFQVVSHEIDELENVAQNLSTQLTAVEDEISTLRGDLTQEVARATAEENRLQAELNQLDLEIDAIHGETGILASSKSYTDTKADEIADRLTQLEGTLTGSSTDLESKLTDLSETVEANKTAIEAKTTEFGESLNTVEERVAILEGQMVELSEADERLDDEIQEIKHHFSNKGSDTLIFATRQAFEQAELSPKTGDLIYILDEKKAYIYSSDEFILFDEITTEEDLKDFIKTEEVETALGETDSHLSTEIERAQSVEDDLKLGIETLNTEANTNSQATVGLEDSTQAHQTQIDKLAQDRYTEEEVNRLVDEAVEQQMAVLSEIEPEFGRIGHVWLEEIFFED